MKQEIDKKIMFVIMIIMITVFSVIILFNNKPKKIEQFEIKRKEFAMYVDDGEGYKEYTDSDTFPVGYYLNLEKSKCEDENGNKIQDITEKIEQNGNKITVKSNKTVYCTLYFDNYKGTGEKDMPYRIQYIEELVELQEAVNGGETYAGKYFELARDLDFAQNDSYKDYTTIQYGDINGTGGAQELKTELTSGTGWKPIGNTETNSFQGIFDGKEHTINNIYISNTITSGSVGLFGVIKNAIVMNLKINGTINSSVGANMGSIVGRVYGKSTIKNIESNTNITGITDSGSIGGIIGSTSGGDGDTTLAHLINKGTITNGKNSGGIIGWMEIWYGMLINCYNYGKFSNIGPINPTDWRINWRHSKS